jgi:surface protein
MVGVVIFNNNMPLSQWYMFKGATSFNQDLSAWDVSQGTAFVSV